MTIEIIDESKGIPSNIEDYYSEIEGLIRNIWTIDNTARLPQIKDIETLRELIYSSYPSQIKYGQEFILPDLPEAKDTLLTHLCSNVYTSNDGMFNIKGRDSLSIENAPKQKSAIVEDLDNMNFKTIWEDMIEDFAVSGELIGYVTYTERKRKRRARISDLKPIVNGKIEDDMTTNLKKTFPTISKLLMGEQTLTGLLNTKTGDIINEDNTIRKTESHIYYNATIFEGTNVIPIRSEDFIWDVQKYNRQEDAYVVWRTYLTPQEILTNQDYNFDEETKKIAKDLIKSFETVRQTAASQGLIWEKYVTLSPDSVGNQLQVYNYYGDLVLGDGTELNNYVITCCMGKVIKCEPNPAFVNGFVYYAPDLEPNYRRGVPLLKRAIIFNAIRSCITQNTTDLLALIMNPPMLMPKGMLEAKVEQYEPGGKIEYEPSEQVPGGRPEPIADFSTGLKAALDVIGFFEGTIESSTGLTKNLAGEAEPEQKTATEINQISANSTGRLGYLSDKIKRFLIDLIEKIAEVKAINEFDDVDLTVVDNENNPKTIKIDSTVRNGNYKYEYQDANTAAEMKQKFMEFDQFCNQFIPAGIINVQALAKKGLEILAIDNPDQFLNQSQVDQTIDQAIQQVPDAQKPQAKQQLQQLAGGLLQQHLQQAQQQQGQQQQGGQPNVSQG